jgi:hypothetical protein
MAIGVRQASSAGNGVAGVALEQNLAPHPLRFRQKNAHAFLGWPPTEPDRPDRSLQGPGYPAPMYATLGSDEFGPRFDAAALAANASFQAAPVPSAAAKCAVWDETCSDVILRTTAG